MSTKSGFLQRFGRHWISAVLFLIPLILYLVGVILFHLPDLWQHLLLTITAVMGIHVLDRLFLVKDTKEALNSLVHNIQDDISKQTSFLLSTSKSLEALHASGIVQIYPNRMDASKDIKTDLSNPTNSKIYLLGISLNDFIQGLDQNLGEAWFTIQQFIQGKRYIESRMLDIRVLIIDPFCWGAVLRAEAESVSTAAVGSRLKNDVDAAAKELLSLEKMAASGSGSKNVTFACRLYRLPPIMFLCWVDSVCYVQQYHFWSRRDNRTPIPVLKYRNLPASEMTYSYHREMRYHFEWIWENAAIPVSEYLNNAVIGTDAGIHGCAIINIYGDLDKARERICYLLKNAKHKVTIQGIALDSFFEPGPLFEAVLNVLREEKAEVEVLLLNPDSDQAKFRSYREHLFSYPNKTYEEYISQGDHYKSELVYDTKRTIDTIKEMVDKLQKSKGVSWRRRLTLGLYDTAPACFVLRIDDHVLVEQYHYGKVTTQMGALLGKDMPLIEYIQTTDSISEKAYPRESNPLRRPFDLLVDHLQFVFTQAKKVNLFE